MKKYKSSITLIEAVTVVAIFSVISATTGSILFTSSRTGSRLAEQGKVFQDITWAIDYMVSEARWGTDFHVAPAPFDSFDLITFISDTNRNGTDDDDPCIWYWRGFNATVNGTDFNGSNDTLYRGVDSACNANFTASLQAANTSRQELAKFLVDNPVNSTGNTVWLLDYNNTTREFSTVLSAEEPIVRNRQSLKARVVALNVGAAPVVAVCPGKLVYNFTQNKCYDTIQAAVNEAVNGDEIRVRGASGGQIFREAVQVNDKGISLKGGYAAGFDEASRNPQTLVTTIDGENTRRPLYVYISSTLPSRAVTVDGFTIQRGSANTSGGGVYVSGQGSNTSINLSNNSITDNHCDMAGSSGGGVYIEVVGSNSSAIFSNNTITNNTAAAEGPGVYFDGRGQDGTASLLQNIVSSNILRGIGGGHGFAVYARNSFSIIVSNNEITANTAESGALGGGGISLNCRSASSMTVSGNTITGNSRTGGNGGGSSVYVLDLNSQITFTNNTISNNIVSNSGAGINIRVQNSGLLNLSNNTIASNTAGSIGGGIYTVVTGSTATISNNTIINNTANMGGGVYTFSSNSGSTSFSNNTIGSNAATNAGGGVYADSNSGSTSFSNNTIGSNTATFNGGGVYVYSFNSSSFFFSNNSIGSNVSGGFGGGATILSLDNGSVSFSNNIISGNTVSSAGGGFSAASYDNSSISFSNNIISANTAATYAGGFSASSYDNGSISFSNNTVSNNTANSFASGAYINNQGSGIITLINAIIFSNPGGSNFSINGGGVISVTYSDIGGGYAGTGNINANPLFVNPPNDYHLQAGSPCINTGDPDAAYNDPDGTRNDMGAYGGPGGGSVGP